MHARCTQKSKKTKEGGSTTRSESSNCAPADQNKNNILKDMLYTLVAMSIRVSKDAALYWYV